jgi:glycosyltransferase involved in cell wall biosynthesis
MPSTYEGFGMAYLEAMGFGLPVIASAAGGAREIVREGVNGFLVEPGDRPALVRRLRELMSDVALRRRLGGEARRTWEAHPDWEAAFAQVGPFLKRMLDGERR